MHRSARDEVNVRPGLFRQKYFYRYTSIEHAVFVWVVTVGTNNLQRLPERHFQCSSFLE